MGRESEYLRLMEARLRAIQARLGHIDAGSAQTWVGKNYSKAQLIEDIRMTLSGEPETPEGNS